MRVRLRVEDISRETPTGSRGCTGAECTRRRNCRRLLSVAFRLASTAPMSLSRASIGTGAGGRGQWGRPCVVDIRVAVARICGCRHVPSGGSVRRRIRRHGQVEGRPSEEARRKRTGTGGRGAGGAVERRGAVLLVVLWCCVLCCSRARLRGCFWCVFGTAGHQGDVLVTRGH